MVCRVKIAAARVTFAIPDIEGHDTKPHQESRNQYKAQTRQSAAVPNHTAHAEAQLPAS